MLKSCWIHVKNMLKTFGLFQELNLVDSLLLFVWWMTGQGKCLQCLQCFDSRFFFSSHEKIFQHGFAILNQKFARQFAWAWPCMFCGRAWRFAQRHFRENALFEQGRSIQSREESFSCCRSQRASRFCCQHGHLRTKRFCKAQVHDNWQKAIARVAAPHFCLRWALSCGWI